MQHLVMDIYMYYHMDTLWTERELFDFDKLGCWCTTNYM